VASNRLGFWRLANWSRQGVTPVEGAPEHAGKIQFAVRLGQQEDATIEPAMMDDGVFGLAGREQHLERRTPPRHFIGELPTVHLAGHDHVGEKQIEPRPTIGDCQSFGCIGGR
jgi:hypothetical protein